MPFLNNLKNPFEKFILSSSLHGLLSDDLTIINFTDQHTGKKLSFPVEYQREKRFIRIVCSRDDSCWRNFSYGSPVEILIRGVSYRGWAELVEDEDELIKEWSGLLRHKPEIAKNFGIELSDTNSGDLNAIPDELENYDILRIDISSAQ